MSKKRAARQAIARRQAIANNDETEVVRNSSGNVFADLGMPDAEEHLAKATIAHTICNLIHSARLSQKMAAERLGIDQPKVSALMRGRLRDFSTERLMRFVTALDRDVIITIRQPRDAGHASVRVLVNA